MVASLFRNKVGRKLWKRAIPQSEVMTKNNVHNNPILARHKNHKSI